MTIFNIICYLIFFIHLLQLCLGMITKGTTRDAGTRKGPGGQTLLKGTEKILTMYVKIHARKFKGSVAFFLRQILTHHILSIASAITLDINTSQMSSIYTATVGFIITKSTLKTNCYIIFFILKGHFCPPCPSQQKARGAAAPPAPPPVPASLVTTSHFLEVGKRYPPDIWV